MPVRAFPNVWIVSSRGRDDRRVARALAAHLRERKTSRVELVSRRVLAERRVEGKVHAATVVVELAVRHEQRTHAEWGTDPELLCDELGCEGVGGETGLDVERIRSRLSVRVSDGATDRELQHLTLRVVEHGSTFLAMRVAAVSGLIERLQVVTEQRARKVPIELYPVADLDGMDDALDLAEEGRWEEARASVEALAAGPAAGLPPRPHAVFLHDLSLIRRFSGREPTLEDLAGARAALEEAMRLSPSRRYRAALRDVAAHQRTMLRVLEQRAAARHNFELAAAE
jgi:hypothetical protein